MDFDARLAVRTDSWHAPPENKKYGLMWRIMQISNICTAHQLPIMYRKFFPFIYKDSHSKRIYLRHLDNIQKNIEKFIQLCTAPIFIFSRSCSLRCSSPKLFCMEFSDSVTFKNWIPASLELSPTINPSKYPPTTQTRESLWDPLSVHIGLKHQKHLLVIRA